jgi:hypothetical protein
VLVLYRLRSNENMISSRLDTHDRSVYALDTAGHRSRRDYLGAFVAHEVDGKGVVDM